MADSDSPWLLYILRCADGSLYTGITNDLQRRLDQHNRGRGARYTRGRGPCELTYTESFNDRAEASRREYAIKRLTLMQKRALIRQACKAVG